MYSPSSLFYQTFTACLALVLRCQWNDSALAWNIPQVVFTNKCNQNFVRWQTRQTISRSLKVSWNANDYYVLQIDRTNIMKEALLHGYVFTFIPAICQFTFYFMWNQWRIGSSKNKFWIHYYSNIYICLQEIINILTLSLRRFWSTT